MGLFDFVGKVVKTVTDTAAKVVDTGVKTIEKTTGIDLPGGYTRSELRSVRSATTKKTLPTQSGKTVSKTTTTNTITPPSRKTTTGTTSVTPTSHRSSGRRSSSGWSRSRTHSGGGSYVPPTLTRTPNLLSPQDQISDALKGNKEDVILITDDKGNVVGYSDIDKQMTIVGKPDGSYRVHGVYNPNSGFTDTPWTAPVDSTKEAKTLYNVVKHYSGDERKALEIAAASAASGGSIVGSRNPQKPNPTDKLLTETGAGTRLAAMAANKKAKEAEQAVEQANKIASDYSTTAKQYNEFVTSAQSTLNEKAKRVEELERLLKSYPEGWRPRTREQYEHYRKLYKEYKSAVEDYNKYLSTVKSKEQQLREKLGYFEKEYKSARSAAEKELSEYETARSRLVDVAIEEAFTYGKLIGQETAYYKTPKGQKELYELESSKAAYDFYNTLNRLKGIDKAKFALASAISTTFLTPVDKSPIAATAAYIETYLKTGDRSKAAAEARKVIGEGMLHLKSISKEGKIDVGRFASSFISSAGGMVTTAPLVGEIVGGGSTILAARSAAAQKILGSKAMDIALKGVVAGSIGYHGYSVYSRTSSIGRAATVAGMDLLSLKLFNIGAKEGAKSAKAWIERELSKATKYTTVVGKDMRYITTDKMSQIYGNVSVRTRVASGVFKGRVFENKFRINTSVSANDNLSSNISVSFAKGKEPSIFYHQAMTDADVLKALKEAGINVAGSSNTVTVGIRSGKQLSHAFVGAGGEVSEITSVSKYAQIEASAGNYSYTKGLAKVFADHGRYLMMYSSIDTGKVLRLVGVGKSSNELIGIGIAAKKPTINYRGITSAPQTPLSKTFAPSESGGGTVQLKTLSQKFARGSGSANTIAGTITSFASAGVENVKAFVSSIKPITVLMPPALKERNNTSSKTSHRKRVPQYEIFTPNVKSLANVSPKVKSGIVASVKDAIAMKTVQKPSQKLRRIVRATLSERLRVKSLASIKQRIGQQQKVAQRVRPALIASSFTPPKYPHTYPVPPILPVQPLINTRPIGLALLRSGNSGQVKRTQQRKSLRARKSIFDVMPKPTLYTADKMIKEFGKVIVPQSAKVKKAYWEWVKSGAVGEFDPLSVFKSKDARGRRNKRRYKKNSIGGML